MKGVDCIHFFFFPESSLCIFLPLQVQVLHYQTIIVLLIGLRWCHPQHSPRDTAGIIRSGAGT